MLTRLLTILGLAMTLAACSAVESVKLPPRITGQIADDYQLQTARGVAVARIVVTTQGEPGFGPISNPLYVQFHPGEGQGRGKDREQFTVTLSSGAYVFTGDSSQPSVWRYQAPGLMAMSLPSGKYDALAIAYPDGSHETATPPSIPAPSNDFIFAPVEIPGDGIAYLGDIEIRQSSSGWDLFADKIDVVFSVTDNYDRAVADFRARYPQFKDVKVERRVLMPVPQD